MYMYTLYALCMCVCVSVHACVYMCLCVHACVRMYNVCVVHVHSMYLHVCIVYMFLCLYTSICVMCGIQVYKLYTSVGVCVLGANMRHAVIHE